MAKITLEELVVELSANNKALVTQLKASQSETTKAMGIMAKSVDGFAKDSNKSVSGFQRTFETAIGFIGGQLVLDAFGRAKDAAVALFKSLVNDGVAAAQVQEDAIQKLNTQLALNGQYSKASSQDMQDFASQLQETTKIGDETTLQMLAMASTFGKSNEETKKLTLAAIELSAATGMSLEGAVKNLGKTYAGMTGELGESLPIIRTLTAEQLKNGEALDLIIKRFGGSAAAQIKTYSGAVQQLSNTFGDTTEEIGFVFTQNAALMGSINVLSEAFKGGGEEVKANREALQRLVADGIILVAESLPVMVMSLGVTVDMFIETIKWTHALTGGLADLVGANEQAEEAAEKFAAATATQDKAAATFERIAMAADRMKNKIIEAAEQGSAAQAEMNAMYEAQSEAARKAKEEEMLVTEEQKKNAEVGRELALNAILAIEEDNAVKNELQAEQYALEQEQLQAALDQKLISQQQYLAAVNGLEEKRAKDQDNIRKKQQAAELLYDQQRLSAASTLFTGLASLAAMGGRKTFMIAKRLAQAQAITDGVRAVQAALANPPGPPWSIATAVGVGTMAAANVARIEAQQFNKGGTVPGIGFQDTVPAMLTPQEEVVDRSTSKLLRQYLNSAMSAGPGGEMTFRHLFEFMNFDGFVEVIESKIIERRGMGTSLLQGSF